MLNFKNDLERIYNVLSGFQDGTYEVDIVDTSVGAVIKPEPLTYFMGYQVSFVNDSNKDDMISFERDFHIMSSIVNEKVNFGVYNGIPELSFWVPNVKLAIFLGLKFKQHSIWDWMESKEMVLDSLQVYCQKHKVDIDGIINKLLKEE